MISPATLDQTFLPFDASHFGALITTFATSVILVMIVRTWEVPKLATVIRWTLVTLLLGSWSLWFVLLYAKRWVSVATVLPMHLCDWATIVVTITLIRPNQRSYELAYFWALGGTLQALLTPDLVADFPDPRFLIFFALHGGVIASVLFLTLGLRMRPWPSSIPRVIAWSLIYFVAAITVDTILGTNFGYLRAKPAQPSLLDFLAPWPYYIGEMMLLGSMFVALLYSPFLTRDWLARRRKSVLDLQERSDEVGPQRFPKAWTFRSLLDDMARRGEAPALIAMRASALHTISFEELTKRTLAFANELLDRGIKPGESVALLVPNGIEWVIARLALGAIGAVAAAIDDLATDEELRVILSSSRIARILCGSSRAEALRRSNETLDIIILDDKPAESGTTDTQLRMSAQDTANLSGGAPAMLAYTSGTTGAPKAIVLTHSNIETNVRALALSGLVGPGDRVLLPLPLQHVYPFVVGLLTPLSSGAAVVFPESATGPQLLEAIHRADVSAIVGVPRLYSAICSGLIARVESSGYARLRLFQSLLYLSTALRRYCGIKLGPFLFARIRARFGARLRLLVCGGAKLESAVLWTLLGLGFDVRSGYGLAETAAMFTGNLPGSTRWESEGRPIAGAVRIAAPDSAGNGEIEVRGPQLFSRYLDNAEATRAAFTADGWFRTGDVGRIDRDGFLFVFGRAKDTLVLGGGKKIDPEQLEKVYGAGRYIREIAIFEYKGGLAALVVPSLEAVRQGGAVHIDTAIRIDLASSARALQSYQRLAGFAIVHEPLPRTRLGKYRRFLLPAIYEKARSGVAREAPVTFSAEDQALLEEPVARQVYELLLKRYQRGQIRLDASPLLDLGIDSLEWISFGLELEDRLKLRLSEAEIGSVVTVRDLLILATRGVANPVTPSPATLDWISPTGAAFKSLGVFLYAFNWVLMRAFFRLHTEQSGEFPSGNFILIANHTSYLDAPAIAAALPYRVLCRCYWAGDPALLFSRVWLRPFMHAVQCFPADERAPAQTLATCETLLRRGNSIVWFPEGWRSPDGALQPFLPGIGHLLKRVSIPVLPLHIDGAFNALPRDRSMPKLHPIRVRVGRPILPAEWQALQTGGKNAPQAVADLLHRIIDGLGRSHTDSKAGDQDRGNANGARA